VRTNILIALGIIAALAAAYLLHNVFPVDSPMDEYLTEVERAILAEEWSKAAEAIEKIDREWKRSRLLISINNSRSDLQEFIRTLAVLQAYVEVQDRAGAYAEAAHLRERWWRFAE